MQTGFQSITQAWFTDRKQGSSTFSVDAGAISIVKASQTADLIDQVTVENLRAIADIVFQSVAWGLVVICAAAFVQESHMVSYGLDCGAA